MSNRPRRAVPLVLLSGVFLFAACDGDDAPTGPAADAAPPEVSITVASDAGVVETDVTLEWIASDDVGLASVAVSWATTGLRQTFRATGREDSGSLTHRYEGPGEFTIAVTATDGAGKTASATHAIAVVRPPPSAPRALEVAVDGNALTVGWEPGAWTTNQEVVVSRPDGLEVERVHTFANRHAHETVVQGLAWETSYEVRVVAANESGRAESAPVAVRTQAPIPPFLYRLSAATDDPTCLVVVWGLGPHEADAYDVVFTGGSEAESFDERVSGGGGPDSWPWDREVEARFCAPDHPVVDGATYTAQVFAVYGDQAYGSNVREWAVDFFPVYTAAGTWSAISRLPDVNVPSALGPWYIYTSHTLELVEVDGAITGTWTTFDAAGVPVGTGPVTGTRAANAVELTLLDPDAIGDPAWTDVEFWGEGSFAGGDGMVLTLQDPLGAWFGAVFERFYQRQ